MDKKEQEERRLINEINEKKFKNNVKYLMEHSGSLTVFITVITAIVTFIFKTFIVAYDCGTLDHYGIIHGYISISNEGKVYVVFLYMAFFVLYLVICNQMYKWIRIRGLKNIIEFIGTYIFTMFIVFLVIQYREGEKGIRDFFTIGNGIVLFIVVLFMIVPGILCVHSFHADQQESNHKSYVHKYFNIKVLAILLIGISLEISIIYGWGRSSANSKKNYKIINNTEAVIYENADIYIVSPCEIDETNNIVIFNHTQKIIDKKNVTTEQQRFEKVSLGKVAMTK
ncbi:hypothetical protein KQI22_10445 [Kineothrix sp. MSJ-39]|uniref:hypothetical protein n=1 Tax=Kineothrix sp. MSJ-39 TaxID=2841533 RepID=UPI001C1092C8|nr:hypothetical protein [Kineothrix sp. MSJ-39]MBU5430476.1 hypothetical protein [Kineothrix sp. MSJ-39]